MAKELYAVLAEISTYGTISTYTPLASISAETYLLPPPTTIVGALHYAYKRASNDFKELKDAGYSPATELVEGKRVLYAAAGIAKPVTVSKTIEKLYQHIYMRKQHWSRTQMAYTIGVRPVAIVDKLYIFLIVNGEDLAKYCYAITRLGRKESLVAVDNVISVPVEKALTSERFCETGFYFPHKIAKEYSPKGLWVEVDMPALHRDNYLKKSIVLERYVMPAPYSDVKATVHLNENGVVLSIRSADGKAIKIPVPKEVVAT
ncbi:MAG: type I-A CRISPR-associated protein Cas5a [Ignisphaera sp.]